MNICSLVGNVLHAMVADNYLDKLKNALKNILNDYLERRLPLRRIAFLSSVLRLTNTECYLFNEVNSRILAEQKEDGGWIDCEDTIWNTYLLSFQNTYLDRRLQAIKWLNDERSCEYGWGFCKRDNPNIPLTSQVLFFIPELRNQLAFDWLEKEWLKDLNFSVNLNYKGAWYLLVAAQKNITVDSVLYKKTIEYLKLEQREDGGWGPWKNHPAVSDPFITGLCCLALSNSYKTTRSKEILVSLQKSINWFESNQLTNGLFPTHYIEEGSAWCYIGWKEAFNCLL